jgi:hypothetical protein
MPNKLRLDLVILQAKRSDYNNHSRVCLSVHPPWNIT